MNNKTILIIALLIYSIMAISALAEPPIPTNYSICSQGGLQNEQQIFVCPTDSNIVCADWRDFRLGYRRVGVGRSTDAGDTWTNNLISLALLLQDRQSDPTMAVDNDGNFYINVLDYHDDGPESYLTFIKSTDKGISWTGPYPVVNDWGNYFEDKQFITVDRTHGPHEGNVYISWTRFDNPTRIMFARSTDGVESFDDTLIVGPIEDFSACGGPSNWDAGHFSNPLVGSDGSVYVFWPGAHWKPPDCIYYRAQLMVKSIDGGVTFTDPVMIYSTNGFGQVDGAVEVYDGPVLAADMTGGTYDGNLYLAVANADISNTIYEDWNIEFIKSSDGGTTWSDPIYINDDYTGMGALYDQFHPWMAINEEGTLVAIWYDQRTDPVDHYKFDLFAAYSFDGGASFTTNHRISEISVDPDYLGYTASSREDQYRVMDPRKDHEPTVRAGKIAEYIGVTAFKDHVNAVWTDTRNYNQDTYGANWVIPLLRPRLLEPGDDDLTLSNPVFNWATAWKENDDQYLIEIATDDQFDNIIYFETVTETENALSSPLDDGTYYWRVQASTISTRETTEYSDTHTFTVDTYLPPVPALISPADETVSKNDYPEFEWDLGETPSSDVYYDLLISADETFTDETIMRRYDGLTATNFTTPDILYTDTVYYWTVSAENWAEQTKGFADAFSYELVYYTCADVDGEPGINILDIVFLLNYKYKGGPAPDPLIAGEIDGIPPINILDIVYLINYKYKSGAEPVCE